MILGMLMIAAALLLASYNLYDGLRAEQAGRMILERLVPEKTDTPEGESVPEEEQKTPEESEKNDLPDYVLYPNMGMPVKTIDGLDIIGLLRIPVLNLELPVISHWSYPNLKMAPCRYSGSVYLNNLIICGDNYSSHFGQLKNLREGDLAVFTDMDGNVFSYRMVERETLNSTDVDEMERGAEGLTLFTCTIGGKTRVTIRFELAEE